MITPIIVATVIVVLMLGAGAAVTTVGPWYRGLRKPSWNPPAWVFGPAWTIILGLAGWAGVLGWIHTGNTGTLTTIMVLFGINIALHLLWSPLFFNLRRPDWALIEMPFLWLSIAALMFMLAPV